MSVTSRRRGARRRVLVVINDLAHGGAQRAAVDQAAGLDPDRFEVEVASLELAASAASVGGRSGVVPLRRLRVPGASPMQVWGRLSRVLDGFRPELVHTHLAAATLIGTVAARLRGVPHVVSTFHNLTDWQEKRLHPLRLASRGAARFCDRAVAVSQAVKAAIAATSPKLGARTEVIPNGVDLEPFREIESWRAAERERLGYAPSDFVVGAVARFDPRKGLDLLIEAAARALSGVPELRLLLVGDGRERRRLEDLVRARGLEGRVAFPGFAADVRTYLAAMDLFAVPSRTEGQGIAIVEALAAGLPVLGSDVGGIPEVVTEDVCGHLLPPDAPDPWAHALARLAREVGERQRLAAGARRRAEVFSLQETVRKLQWLYERLDADQDTAQAAA